eukprot:10907616-Alexandrium_andersonii.AAC.1
MGSQSSRDCRECAHDITRLVHARVLCCEGQVATCGQVIACMGQQRACWAHTHCSDERHAQCAQSHWHAGGCRQAM